MWVSGLVMYRFSFQLVFLADLIEKNAGDGLRSFYNHLGKFNVLLLGLFARMLNLRS